MELTGVEDDIGMNAHKSPSVFVSDPPCLACPATSPLHHQPPLAAHPLPPTPACLGTQNFYQPEYAPPGRVEDAGLVSPEAGLATAPFLMGYLNGVASLVSWGLTSCFGGFGTQCPPSSIRNSDPERARAMADGQFSYSSSSLSSGSAAVLSDLDLLLTSGRLGGAATALIEAEYERVLADGGTVSEALEVAVKLVAASAAFHTSSRHAPPEGGGMVHDKLPPMPPPSPPLAALTRPYKAIVVLFLSGGIDSYNLLVPHSGCTAKDLNAEYESVRGDVKVRHSIAHSYRLSCPISDFASDRTLPSTSPQPTRLYPMQCATDPQGRSAANLRR